MREYRELLYLFKISRLSKQLESIKVSQIPQYLGSRTWGEVASKMHFLREGTINPSREEGSEEQRISSQKILFSESFLRIFFIIVFFPLPGLPFIRRTSSFKGLYKSDKYALKPRGVLAPKKNFVFILSLPFYNYITNNMQKFSKGE